MRKIIFRGQAEKFHEEAGKWVCEWVYGGALQGNGGHSVIYGIKRNAKSIRKYVVRNETLGQYTGLHDKNGERIFEGDIIRTKQFGKQSKDNKVNFNGYDVFAIIYHEGKYELDNASRNFILAGEKGKFSGEVIGNIHDNPELLKPESSETERE